MWYGRFRSIGQTVYVQLDMTKNAVRSISMYVKRSHVCYPFYVTCDGVK